jgi:hypothetical protein
LRRVGLPWRRAATHDVPVPACGCGVHAGKELQAAADYLFLYHDVRQSHLRHRAIGRVSLWGSVVEGEKGWRASRAYPEHIFIPRADRSGRPTDVDALLEGLADYGVPVEVLDDDAQTPVARAVRRVEPRRRRRRRAKATS